MLFIVIINIIQILCYKKSNKSSMFFNFILIFVHDIIIIQYYCIKIEHNRFLHFWKRENNHSKENLISPSFLLNEV